MEDGTPSNGVTVPTPKLPPQKRQKWFFLLVLSLLLSTFLIFLSIFISYTPRTLFLRTPLQKPKTPLFVESHLQLHISPTSNNQIPRIAYLISGSMGDGESLKRALMALYHPLNQYAVHLDLEASSMERLELVNFVKNEALFAEVGNVRVVVRSNLVTYRGPTMVSNTLHAASILLKEGGDWDWFINLSASDYPLVTQDDLLHVLSTIPRDLNFIEHTSDIGWKEYQRARPVIVDPGFYTKQKSDVFWVTEQRSTPTAFKLFTGSAWVMLTRAFMEYTLAGWESLPRTSLMYYANFLSSPEGYFHTLICNSGEFRNTTVSHDLHFISWDNPPKQHPHFLTADNFENMVESDAPFARKFGRGDPVLDRIDAELLGRDARGFVPGGWLVRHGRGPGYGVAPGAVELKPGAGAVRLRRLIGGLLSRDDFRARQCV